MKQTLYSLSLCAATLFGLCACNNGKYDANPAVDNSNVPNPLGNSGVATLGTIVAKLNGVNTVFYNAKWAPTIGTGRFFGGGNGDNSSSIALNLYIDNYTGPNTYTAAPGVTDPSIIHTTYTNGGATFLDRESGVGPSGVQIVVQEDANDRMKGTFQGVVYQEDLSGNIIDSIVISDGTFIVQKL